MNAIQEVMLLREAAAVKRYHTVRTVRSQTLGDHVAGTLLLLEYVMPEARKELWMHLLHHDLPELLTGDVPAPVKRQIPALAIALEAAEVGTAPLYRNFYLTPFEEALVKWCDTMELVLFALEELQMGNTFVLGVLSNGISYLRNDPGFVRAHPVCGPRVREVEDGVMTLAASLLKGHDSEGKYREVPTPAA